jgi:hypothetical protein
MEIMSCMEHGPEVQLGVVIYLVNEDTSPWIGHGWAYLFRELLPDN